MADCRKCKHNYKMPGDEPRCNLMCDGESDFEPITNYDRIQGMSIEELAEFFNKFDNICGMCSKNIGCFIVDADRCKNNILEWLQSEAE